MSRASGGINDFDGVQSNQLTAKQCGQEVFGVQSQIRFDCGKDGIDSRMQKRRQRIIIVLFWTMQKKMNVNAERHSHVSSPPALVPFHHHDRPTHAFVPCEVKRVVDDLVMS